MIVRLSLLDRLVKDPPVLESEETGPPTHRHSRDWLERQMQAAVRALRKSVQENLEWLLNTRRIPPPPRVSFAGVKPGTSRESGDQGRGPTGQQQRPPVETSVYFYGLPSFAHIALSPGAQEYDLNLLAAEIEGSIRIFEPRILDPKVSVEQMPSLNREVRFRVTGKLKIDPDPEFVQYLTLLDIDTGFCQVEITGENRG
jgi:type VI secretion system lysozyme-like protein